MLYYIIGVQVITDLFIEGYSISEYLEGTQYSTA